MLETEKPHPPGAIAARLKAALRLQQSGDWDQASREFEAIIASSPNLPKARIAYGRALARQADNAGAEVHLRHATLLAPDSPDAWIALGQFYSSHRRSEDARNAFQKTLEIDPNSIGALVGLAQICTLRTKLLEAYQLYQRALVLAPDEPRISRLYAKALSKHATKLARRAAELTPNSADAAMFLSTVLGRADMLGEAKIAAQRATEIDPSMSRAHRQVKAIDEVIAEGRERRRPSIWPARVDLFRDLENVVKKYVLTGIRPANPILGPNSKVVTLGSCFAEHVANKLRDRKVDVFYRKISEDINNSYANRALLEWVGGKSGNYSDILEETYGANTRILYQRQFSGADVVILSLGVAAAFFDRHSGEFRLPDTGVAEGLNAGVSRRFRTLSLDENVENFRYVIRQIREFSPSAHIVLTVSPVPLSGTYERPSAVLADAVSKSVQRLTVEELLADGGLHYWPSFEIVRWLGTHLPVGSPPAFGADDGSTRHVSNWLVELIMNLFIEYFGHGFASQPPALSLARPSET